MGFFDKKQTNNTNYTDYSWDYYDPTGVDGSGNYTLGAGALDQSLNYGAGSLFGGSAPIAAPIFEGNEGDIFAPINNFSGPGGGGGGESPAVAAARAAYEQQKGGTGPGDSTFLDWWLQNGDSLGVNSLAENPVDAELIRALADSGNEKAKQILGGGTAFQSPQQIANNFNLGGSENSFGLGGSLSGAVASGDDSLAIQSGGGSVSLGDDSPIFNGNNSGLQLGSNADISSPIITGTNTGPIITGDTDGIVNTAPISGPVSFGDDSPVFNITTRSNPFRRGGSAPGSSAPASTGLLGTLTGTGEPETDNTPDLYGSGGGNAVTNLAAGSDSVAQTTGGPSGIVGGGDVDVTGPIITGNSGNVTINDPSVDLAVAALQQNADTVTAAINAAKSATEAAFLATNKALAGAFEFRKDPAERTAADDNKTVLWIALGLGALAFLSR